MGLFDVFKSEPLKLSPRLALAVGLLYMMASDGEIESEEIGQLQSVVGGDQELINTAVKYLRSVKYEQFLADAAALLNERQKLCLLINMADSLLSDGRAEQSEQQAFGKALSQFGVTEDGFKAYFETLRSKITAQFLIDLSKGFKNQWLSLEARSCQTCTRASNKPYSTLFHTRAG